MAQHTGRDEEREREREGEIKIQVKRKRNINGKRRRRTRRRRRRTRQRTTQIKREMEIFEISTNIKNLWKMYVFGLPGKCHKMRKDLRKTFVFGFIEASSAKAGILRHLSAILGHFGPSIAQNGPTIVQYKPRWLKMAQAGPAKLQQAEAWHFYVTTC